MSDDPFAEPLDDDRTVIKPRPGGIGGSAPATPPPLPAGVQAALPNIGVNKLVAAASPLLAAAVRLRGRAQHPDPDALKRAMVAAVREFEKSALATGLDTQSLRAARYALCATLDDLVLNTPWGTHSAWAQQSLISIFHNEVTGGERFYDVLEQMQRDLGKHLDVVELMYVCLSLGFEGRYRVLERGQASLAELRDSLYRTIRNRRGEFERELAPHWKGVAVGFRPLAQRVPLPLIGGVALLLLGFVYLGYSFALAGPSDAVLARLAALPPPGPLLPRQLAVTPALVQPAAPAAAPAPLPESDLTSRLRKFLAPEIAQKLVDVVEDGQTVTVRIANRNMFASGSATLNAGYLNLIERIGLAIEAEPGRVLVTGHTDPSPIRTVRFPSNWHLSQERADSVAKLVAAKLSDPRRVKAEGKADTQPLTSNATPEGQQQNRRTDIILIKPAE